MSHDKILRFPHDDRSVGEFRTKLTFKSWGQKDADENQYQFDMVDGVGVDKTQPELGSKYQFVIWLPMPLQLATGYTGEFAENDDMFHMERGDIINHGDKGYLGPSKTLSTGMTQLTKEVANIGAKIVTPNASVRMSRASVLNNDMGMLYSGARLRSHTFSWRFSPKNSEEQESVFNIIKAIKMASTPLTSGIGGGFAEDVETEKALAIKEIEARIAGSSKALQVLKNEGIEPEPMIENIDRWKEELQNLQDSGILDSSWLKHITSLSIPDTVSMSFYQNYRLNNNLFKVNDSFITSFDINYTAAGNWAAHQDGAPLETQITMTLKEIAPITKENIMETGN